MLLPRLGDHRNLPWLCKYTTAPTAAQPISTPMTAPAVAPPLEPPPLLLVFSPAAELLTSLNMDAIAS
jgi:hypothetical protein